MLEDKIKNLLKNIHNGWLETQQSQLFAGDDTSFEALANACVDYLRYNGFKVVSPNKWRHNINKLDDLWRFFYTFSDRKHPELINAYRNLQKDRAIASKFVKSRMEATGFSKENAMNECAEIIETIFEHEAGFKFKIPISFGLLGQNNCGWITDKAIQIMNKKRLQEKEERRIERIKKMDEKYESESEGFGDLDELLKN